MENIQEPFMQFFSSSFMCIHTRFGYLKGTERSIQQQIANLLRIEKEQEDKNDPYNHDLIINNDEIVNGYELYKVEDGKPIMAKALYEELVQIWKKGEEMSFKEFYEYCNNEMCSDWSKMDKHGKYFEGYYDYPEGSNEREYAWNWTRRTNIVELFKLPYPLRLLLETIELGCSNRYESVRYSTFLCEWIRRKYSTLNEDDLPLRIVNLSNDILDTNNITESNDITDTMNTNILHFDEICKNLVEHCYIEHCYDITKWYDITDWYNSLRIMETPVTKELINKHPKYKENCAISDNKYCNCGLMSILDNKHDIYFYQDKCDKNKSETYLLRDGNAFFDINVSNASYADIWVGEGNNGCAVYNVIPLKETNFTINNPLFPGLYNPIYISTDGLVTYKSVFLDNRIIKIYNQLLIENDYFSISKLKNKWLFIYPISGYKLVDYCETKQSKLPINLLKEIVIGAHHMRYRPGGIGYNEAKINYYSYNS